MAEIHLKSESRPFQHVPIHRGLASLRNRSIAMGLSPEPAAGESGTDSLRRMLEALQSRQLLRSATIDLAPLLAAGPDDLDRPTAERMAATLERMVDALGESPVPDAEWPVMRALFGDEMLAALVGIAEASLRRYAAGSRDTPQTVAEKLHWLAMVVADLAGAYNAYGMRRWFERPRSVLGGQSPRHHLGTNWKPDDDVAGRVADLARSLSGAPVPATP